MFQSKGFALMLELIALFIVVETENGNLECLIAKV
jgi:hypothetical protein